MNFKEMTLLQLKAYAKEKGIRGVSTLKKNQLIERIIASENKSIQTKAEESIKSEKNTYMLFIQILIRRRLYYQEVTLKKWILLY